MWGQYSYGLLVVLVAGVIAFFALAIETDDLHRFLLLDLVEITALGVIALLGTDLAEALILPGLTVGIAEQLALSQIYCTKERIMQNPVKGLNIEVIAKADAPLIISMFLVVYGLILSGFTGGGVAGLGLVFFFMSRGYREDLNLLEMASGISWALWIFAFFCFMFLPQFWFIALMCAAVGIVLKVTVKMSLVGTMWGNGND
ncbi:MAG: EhaG family protein [Methanoregulaceae archaeon]|jgi:energy-converting hydrogenase A subunit G|nr:EhaG family protein [Methanoregulaceae archaeon]